MNKPSRFVLLTLALLATCLALGTSAPAAVPNVPDPSATTLPQFVSAQPLATAQVMPAAVDALVIAALVLTACAWLLLALSRRLPVGRRVIAVNTLPANVGSSHKVRRYRASGAQATRYVFVKAGADDEHIAAISATSDKPIGVAVDEAAAAEDPVTVELSGINGRTLPCVAGAALATLNADVYTDATGKVVGKPTAAGTYWKVGRNLTLADAANDPVEVQLCEPQKLIVLAALTSVAGDIADTNSTAVNPTKADFDSLLVAAGKLQADFHLLVAAVKTGADIDYATT